MLVKARSASEDALPTLLRDLLAHLAPMPAQPPESLVIPSDVHGRGATTKRNSSREARRGKPHERR
jgi:hypothetical protein